jgi:arylformamidase
MHTRWLEQTSLYETHLRRHGLAPSVTIVPGHHHFSIMDDYLDPTTLLAKAVLNIA